MITFTSVDNTISQVVQIRQKSVPTETNGTTDEIWYTTTDNNIVDVKSKDWSGATIISNTYENGKGIIKFSKEICHIEGWALQKSHNLLSVTLPQTITSIGDGAFYECLNLKYVHNLSNIHKVGNSSFIRTAISSLSFSNKLDSIGNYAFDNCKNLTTIGDVSNVESVGNYAFNESGIKALNFSSKLTSIGSSAFSNCKVLSYVQKFNRGKIIRQNNQYRTKSLQKLLRSPKHLLAGSNSSFSRRTSFHSRLFLFKNSCSKSICREVQNQ